MHVYCMKMIKNILFEVLSIASYIFFPHVWQLVDGTPKKLSLFWGKPVIVAFSYIFVRREVLVRKCVSHRCKWIVIGRSQVWCVSRARNYFPTERFDRFLDRFCCMWWCIIMKQNYFVLPFLIFWSFFTQSLIQIDHLLSVALSINGFARF